MGGNCALLNGESFGKVGLDDAVNELLHQKHTAREIGNTLYRIVLLRIRI